MSKIAIIFPGMGYHCDKPLLYYGKKLAGQMGYRVIEVGYKGFDTVDTMQAAGELALSQAEEQLKKQEISATDEVLCIAKSIGTVVSAIWQKKMGITAKNVFLTPVKETFVYASSDCGIVFHGTKDPMADTEMVKTECERLHLPLYITENGNHSLECGNVGTDVETMANVIRQVEKYLS